VSKGDAANLLSSDHLIDAPDDLHVHISLLFSSRISHGNIPDSFLHSTVKPIPKEHNQDLPSSNSFRGIAISSLFGKLMDNNVMNRCQHLLVTSELHFGFKKVIPRKCVQ
jgi:hypothetical protein